VLVDGERVVFELPLPIAGLMTPDPLPEVARAERALKARLADAGYAFHDPLFTLLFMTADFLPAVRLTARGVWDVKAGRVLRASQPR
jgi:adenine deaminase